MKWREVFGFELEYQLRRPLVWGLMALVGAYSLFWLHNYLQKPDAEIPLNAPLVLSSYIILCSQCWWLLLAGLCANAAGRDHALGMEALYLSSPLKRSAYLGGRLLAILLMSISWFLLMVLLGMLSLLVKEVPGMLSMATSQALGKALLVIGLPNLLLVGLLLFALVQLSKKPMLAFGVVVLLFLNMVLSIQLLAEHWNLWALAELTDASSLTLVYKQKLQSLPASQASQEFQLTPTLFLNRLCWLGGALGLLFLAGKGSHFTIRQKHGAKKPAPMQLQAWKMKPMPVVKPSFNGKAQVCQLLYLGRHYLQNSLFSVYGLLLLAFLIGFAAILPELMEGNLGVPALPTTKVLLAFFNSTLVKAVGSVLIIALSGRMYRAAPNAGMQAIDDILPVRPGLRYGGMLLGVLGLMFLFQLALVILGLSMQLYHGVSDIAWSAYLPGVLLLPLRDYLLIFILAMACHVLCRQQFLGYLIAALLYLFSQTADRFGLEHPLLQFGSGAELPYLDFSGKLQKLLPWALYSGYWLGLGILLVAITLLAWREARLRLSLLKKLLRLPLAYGGLLLMVVCSLPLLLQLHLRSGYRTQAEGVARRVAYEKQYRQFAMLPQPLISAVMLQLELYPERQEASLQGTYTLVNTQPQPIDTLYLALAQEMQPEALAFNRPASILLADSSLGQHLYRLKEPLQPQDSMQLYFQLHYKADGLAAGRPMVGAASALILSQASLPALGYQPERELQHAGQRKAYGLPERPGVPVLEDTAARYRMQGRELVRFEATIGTADGQFPVAPGELLARWMEGDRQYARYRTAQPIRNQYALASAVYALKEDYWQGIRLQLYHHPQHKQALTSMLTAMKASLEVYSKAFGPYPHPSLRMAETPALAGMASSYPGCMLFSEEFARMQPAADTRGFDLVFAVTAHEVAHQWWANQLIPAPVEGAPLLTESLAWYSALQVVEATHGPEHREKLLEVMREAYERPHAESATPLLRARDPLAAYRNGPFALDSLQQLAGKETINRALRHLLQKHADGQPPLATSLELYRALQSALPDSLHPRLHQLLAQ